MLNKSKFHLEKWYLDFVGDHGEAMIFYAANFTWHGITVPYTSWLYRNTENERSIRSRFRNIHLPNKNQDSITWNDPKFGIKGKWNSDSKPLTSQLYISEKGTLDWYCEQPASNVELKIGDEILRGNGYAEKLILTVLPWHIPMDELRWGRFISDEDIMVWIEIRRPKKKQWLWLNGELIQQAIIEDSYISIPGADVMLKLDQGIVLESEKTIQNVVEKMLPMIPGIKRFMPIHFLMADNYKWLSQGEIQKANRSSSNGTSIHECVYFKKVKK